MCQKMKHPGGEDWGDRMGKKNVLIRPLFNLLLPSSQSIFPFTLSLAYQKMKCSQVIGDPMIGRRKVFFCVWRDEIHVHPLSRLPRSSRLFRWNKRFRSASSSTHFIRSVAVKLATLTAICLGSWSDSCQCCSPANNGEEFPFSYQPSRRLRGY